MIQDQLQTSESHETRTKLDLTVEESFFVELMEKLDPSVINIKYMKNGAKLVKIEQFLNYYSEQEIIQLIESLVTKGRVKKNDKGVVLLCPKCGGHAIMTLLICPRCGSAKIGKRVDLYHAECEYWGPKEEYVEGLLLRCPRCNELLDKNAPEGTPAFYSTSDTNFECQDCGESVSKNNIKMVCLKCNTKFTSSQTHYLNSVSYSLLPEDQLELPKPKKKKQRPIPPVEKQIVTNPKKTKKPNQETPPETTPLITETEPAISSTPESKPIVDPEPEPEKIQKSKKKPKPKKTKKKKQKNEIIQKSINRVSKLLKSKKKSKKRQKTKRTKKKLNDKSKQILKEKNHEKPEKNLLVKDPDEDTRTNNQVKAIDELNSEKMKLQEPSIQVTNTTLSLSKNIKKGNLTELTDSEIKTKHKSESMKNFEPTNETLDAYDESEIKESTGNGKEESKNVLMIEDNITVSELIIESLESLDLPISVYHMDNGDSLLKELRHKYDAIILDLDLPNVDYKLIFSEMEKWSILSPIILLSDKNQNLPNYSLNIVSVIKKKQRNIRKIGDILEL